MATREPSTERRKVIVCKFCNRAVKYDIITNRVHELIGDELHVANCPRREAHFREQSYRAEQSKRDRRLR